MSQQCEKAEISAAADPNAILKSMAPDVSSEVQRALLRRRAELLARPIEETIAREQCEQVVVFLLSGESYALETVYVREAFPLRSLTPLPHTPPHIAGIIYVHGRVLSVVDLRGVLQLPYHGITNLNKVIALRDGSMEFGLLVDEILGVTEISFDLLQPALPTMAPVRAQYLHGITSEQIVVLDAARLLADSTLIVNLDV